MNQLKDRILEISKKLKLSHIGSNLSCLPILMEIYEKKKRRDLVLLDNAHAHLAHLVVRDWYEGLPDKQTPQWFIEKYGIHCDRQAGCDASGGSLGHAIGMGIGYALVDKSRDVYVIVSDGSMMEGSNWEALRIASDLHLTNLHIYCNFNGHSAVQDINGIRLFEHMSMFFYGDTKPEIRVFHTYNTEGFEGVKGHYRVL